MKHIHDYKENWLLDDWYGYGYGYMVWDECDTCTYRKRKYFVDFMYNQKIECYEQTTTTSCL